MYCVTFSFIQLIITFVDFVGSRVIVNKLRIKGNLNTGHINYIDIRNRFKTAVRIDEDTHIKEVKFENISGMYFFKFICFSKNICSAKYGLKCASMRHLHTKKVNNK